MAYNPLVYTYIDLFIASLTSITKRQQKVVPYITFDILTSQISFFREVNENLH